MSNHGTSLEVQWLRLHASNAGGAGSIFGRGTKIPHVSGCSQKVKKKEKKKVWSQDLEAGSHKWEHSVNGTL